MGSAAVAKLQRLLAVASAAEAARLAAVVARIAECHALARQLRGEAAVPGHTLSGAAELAAASRWCQHLHERANAAEARAGELAGEAAALRCSLAIAHGRETAASAMAETARSEELRQADRRAEAALIPSMRKPDQPASSGSDPAT